jgi:hypothetical protein
LTKKGNLSFRFGNFSNQEKDAFVAVGVVIWALLIVCGSLSGHITVENAPTKPVTGPLPSLSNEEWKAEDDRRSGFARY